MSKCAFPIDLPFPSNSVTISLDINIGCHNHLCFIPFLCPTATQADYVVLVNCLPVGYPVIYFRGKKLCLPFLIPIPYPQKVLQNICLRILWRNKWCLFWHYILESYPTFLSWETLYVLCSIILDFQMICSISHQNSKFLTDEVSQT